MSITKEQQQALDDALVPREQRLTIGICNYRLSTTFKPKEPTFQVSLDVLTLTPFYPAFLITASVPAVYMQELWAIKFVDPPFEEEILTFIRELGYPGNIKLLSDFKVDTLPQPAQILWGLYHQEKVDYVYLLWEDLVFQIENKESRKNKYMFFPRFTKVIINYFMSQDQSIPRRNKVDWHMANDDPILTTMRFFPHHEVVQRYGAILPDYLTNLAMKNLKTDEAPKPSSGKRVKAMAKVAKSGKKKQPTFRLETLSDIALSEAEQMKLAIERSKTQLHLSQPNGYGAHERTGVTPGVPDVPTYEFDDEQISWKSSEEEDDDEENVSEHDDDDDDERTESDNDGEDFVHQVFNLDVKKAIKEEMNGIHGGILRRERLKSRHEEDEANDLYRDVNVNLGGRDIMMTDASLPNVQATQETEDTHVILTAPINLEGQQQSSSVSSGFVSNMLNPRPDTGIDSIFNLNTEVTSLVDVPVTTIAEPPLMFETTLPPPPTPLITHMQQTPFPIPTTAPSTSLQDLPNFGSLFGFDHRLKM
ncbi:hypothetical protein Tco_0500831 [Tanacetum coccineum]